MSRPTPPTPLPPKDPNFDLASNHYWVYQRLDQLLNLKHPVTESKDEDLFITVHQLCEISFHQMIIDLGRSLDAFQAALGQAVPIGDSSEVCYFLERVCRLYDVVMTSVPVLTTMRAFAEFRTSLGPSSGFQSYQFRRVELMGGLTDLFWRGGTKGSDGQIQPTETALERQYGAQIEGWFAQYREHSLRHYFTVLTQREPLEKLRDRPHVQPLLAQLARYEEQQLKFHRIHRQVAIQQLSIVGTSYGTGGSSFSEYLQKYEQQQAPLFPGLAGR